MQEHINRGGLRYGRHIRNHLMTDPGAYLPRERTMGVILSEIALVGMVLVAVPMAIVFALMSLGF